MIQCFGLETGRVLFRPRTAYELTGDESRRRRSPVEEPRASGSGLVHEWQIDVLRRIHYFGDLWDSDEMRTPGDGPFSERPDLVVDEVFIEYLSCYPQGRKLLSDMGRPMPPAERPRSVNRATFEASRVPQYSQEDFSGMPCELNSLLMRKLVTHTSDIFTRAVRLRSIPDEAGKRQKILGLSQQYRDAMKSAMAEDKKARIKPDPGSVAQLSEIRAVWHLSEIVLLESEKNSGRFYEQMLLWGKEHFADSATMSRDVDQSDSPSGSPGEHELSLSYWSSVHVAVLLLQFPCAIDLLRNRLPREEDAFVLAISLLKRAHALLDENTANDLSFEDYHEQRAKLAADCEKALESGEFLMLPDLEFIVELLACKTGSLRSVIGQLDRKVLFFSLLPGILFFMSRTLPELKSIAEAADLIMDLFDDEMASPVDLLAYQLCIGDFTEMMAAAEAVGFKWFMAHWTDLLYHAGVLDKVYQQQEKIHVRNYHLKEYATLFFDYRWMRLRSSAWKMALPYFDEVSRFTNSENPLSELLMHLAFGDDDMALQIREVALARDYEQVVASVCANRARHWLIAERYISAIYWAMYSEDDRVIARTVAAALNGLAVSLDLRSVLLTVIIPKPWIEENSFLAFFDDYKAVLALKESHRYDDMSRTLVSIMERGIYPSKFVDYIVHDTLKVCRVHKKLRPEHIRVFLRFLRHVLPEETEAQKAVKKRVVLELAQKKSESMADLIELE